MKTLARQIKRELNLGTHKHCAIYEHELQRVSPPNLKEREARIAQFAKEYEFRLRFIARACAPYSTSTANDSVRAYELRSDEDHRGGRI